MTQSASEIRQQFLDFFKERAHAIVPSSSVVPHNDPTLLFTNAGMNQFKDVFLATGTRDFTRAVDTQKCIRAGGKHNDLEDVGRDTYHHTFFEMLGNWSFGDYFKEDAIKWAWELLTEVWKIDPERLYATVFEGDEADGVPADGEAEAIWAKYLPSERIMRFGKKDNFWEMGETGPCGPCSEIHYDATPVPRSGSGRNLVNAGDPRVIEIWNLVFIQFNRSPGGTLVPLPAKHVDTGMGFERITRVLQKKDSNYDTDIFTPIFAAIQRETGARKYTGKLDDAIDTAYRVIADHVRCLSIAVADGAQPSNEGRGYVLRRILRRAVRHAHQTLGVHEPVMHRIVPAVVETLGNVFPELKSKQSRVESVIRQEEEAFLTTIARGIEHFDEAARDGAISASDAFKLHDTYGFPIDLTRLMAEERGLTVDETGFERLMNEARERSRAGGGGEMEETLTLPPEALARLRHLEIPPTDDLPKYFGRPVTSFIRAIWNGSDFDNDARIGRTVGLIVDRTPFYAEQGGQVADTGTIRVTGDSGQIGGWGAETNMGRKAARFEVTDCRRFGEYVLHVGAVKDGKIEVGDRATIDVDDDRREPVRAHHTTTHLLNLALRQVMGDDVEQKGSLVAPDRLRFDFSCPRALDAKEINAVERLVNAGIHQRLPVHTMEVPLETAKKINGVRAVFGEKYPDPVRVVSIGPSIDRLIAEPTRNRWHECSIEFCGGTHLANTQEARRFVITQETALAAGTRRIVAVTGVAALAAEGAAKELESRLFRAKSMHGDDLVEEVADITRQAETLTIGLVAKQKLLAALAERRDTVKEIQKQSQAQSRQNVVDQARVLAENIRGRIIVDSLIGADAETLRAAGDVIKSRRPDVACMLFAGDEEESKVSILALVPAELIKTGLKAGDWVKVAAQVVGGGGGGKPDMAQAGGKDPAKISDAIDRAKSYAEEMLSQNV